MASSLKTGTVFSLFLASGTQQALDKCLENDLSPQHRVSPAVLQPLLFPGLLSSAVYVSHFPLLHCKVPVVTDSVFIYFCYLAPGPLPTIYSRC